MMNQYIKQQIENLIDVVNILAKGCNTAALKDDLTMDVAEQYTIAEVQRLTEQYVKGLKKIF